MHDDSCDLSYCGVIIDHIHSVFLLISDIDCNIGLFFVVHFRDWEKTRMGLHAISTIGATSNHSYFDFLLPFRLLSCETAMDYL